MNSKRQNKIKLFDSIDIVVGYQKALLFDKENLNYVELLAEEMKNGLDRENKVIDFNLIEGESKTKIVDYHKQFNIGTTDVNFIQVNCKPKFINNISYKFIDAVVELTIQNYDTIIAWLGNNVENLYAILDFTDLNVTKKILDQIAAYGYQSIFIELPFQYYQDYEIEPFQSYKRVIGLKFNSSPKDEVYTSTSLQIIFGTSKFNNRLCGQVSKHYFSFNRYHIELAKHKNSCLFKKIYISKEGNIKNCPSMSENFGNIKDTTLAETFEKPDIKKYWNIKKDKIHVCKDCEYRYICTDCRAYVEAPKDILSKPLKCGYNPYSGEWSEWSTNPLKQKAIDFYEMRDMIEK